MDQVTYFSYRCAGCSGRSRVASRHAGQVIVCPYCQVKAVAVPDGQPLVVPSPTRQLRHDAAGNPVTTSRVARPLDPVTTATIRRQRAAERFDNELLPPVPRSTAPGMAGFADGRPPSAQPGAQSGPGTAAIVRRPVPVVGATPSTATHVASTSSSPSTASITRAAPRPAPASQVPFMWAASTAAILTVVTILACVEASTQRNRWMIAKQQVDAATTELTHVKTTAEELDKRLAQAQTEIAAARAATLRERELVAELQKTNGRMAEELVKASHATDAPLLTTTPTAGSVATMLATGSFPSPVSPSAGVPARNTR